jgi:hypothetical protein
VTVLLFFLAALWIERHGPDALRGLFSHANLQRTMRPCSDSQH